MTENSKMQQRFLTLRKTYINNQFARLNDMQKKAVFHKEGALLILAGAGSGKTTVIVNRVANMVRFGNAYNKNEIAFDIQQSHLEQLENIIKTGKKPNEQLAFLLSDNAVKPYNILAITFTNKAAKELKTRLGKMLGEEIANDINASTFHSACVRILRRNAEVLGFAKSFTIYDTDDSQRVLKDIYKQLQIDDKFLPIRSASSAISSYKDKMITPNDALTNAQHNVKTSLTAKIYSEYAARLKAAGAMDFDDLIYHTVMLLKNNADVLSYYQNRFKYIMVDEYQDTSVAQFMLVDLLASGHGNICVVGDDDQSIYKFRGATIENILQFEEHFPGAKIIRLEENYRSTSIILNAANSVIKNNSLRKGKTLWTNSKDGELVQHFQAYNEPDEAAHIATIIGENLKNGAKLKDHAILYRMNAQSAPLETYFARSGIPYRVLSGLRFYSRKEIKDVLAYMSIVANPKDEVRLRRIINEPTRKIGLTSIENISALAMQEGKTMLEICKNVKTYPTLSRAANAITNFYNIYEKLCDAYENLPLNEFTEQVLHLTGYRQMLENEGEDGQTRLENIGQLISSVSIYAITQSNATLEGFLEEVALISDLDNYDDSADAVVMMTLHSAKGLEFPYVFILGMEEGIFPGERSRYNPNEVEEERRLCYVGLTRAEKRLYLSSLYTRMMFGQTNRNTVSRFLKEIDQELIESVQSNELKRQNAYMSDSYAHSAKQNNFGGGFANSGNFSQSSGGFFGRSGGYSGNATANKSYTDKAQGGGFVASKASALQNTVPKKQSDASYEIGDAVEHKVFGKGIVQKVTPVAGDTIVEIKFESAGVKKTMANYAPLTKIGD